MTGSVCKYLISPRGNNFESRKLNLLNFYKTELALA